VVNEALNRAVIDFSMNRSQAGGQRRPSNKPRGDPSRSARPHRSPQ